MTRPRFAFCASTGRTATMFLARTLDRLPDVVGLHEGHAAGEPPRPVLPLINLHNRRAWRDPVAAEATVRERRDAETLSAAAGEARLLVDVAFYNAPLLEPLARVHPDAVFLVLVRRCEGFVRSATRLEGEDPQPAGWPDPAKPLSDRERFVELGRLCPATGTEDAQRWPDWSAIQRNIWLWHRVNTHLASFAAAEPRCHLARYEDLSADPEGFWRGILGALGVTDQRALERCLASSAEKVNRRPGYQVGPLATWTADERAMHQRLALPLEDTLYG